jgi:RNA 2',3'-cyclic 3'-phosphodiesterase
MQVIRAFIALAAATDMREKIASVQSELKTSEADVKWEPQDKFHVTLKFLGNTEQSKLEPLAEILTDSTGRHRAFEIIYQSLGAFPDPRNPRIVWIGADSNGSILSLQSEIEQACMGVGIPKEDRKFHAHITLGRVKGTRNLVRLTEAIKTITFEPIQSRCTEVLLMKSDLRPGGSIYTTLKSFPLHM